MHKVQQNRLEVCMFLAANEQTHKKNEILIISKLLRTLFGVQPSYLSNTSPRVKFFA